MTAKVFWWITNRVASLHLRKWAKQRPRKGLLLLLASTLMLTISGFPSIPVIAQLEGKLTASDGARLDAFGEAVAINGDTAVVGAPLDDDPNNRGAAYVFVRIGTFWEEQTKLTASDGKSGDKFGWTVAISGDTIVVGAPFNDKQNLVDVGAVYVFMRNGTSWSQQAKLRAADAEIDDFFGETVAISEDEATVVVGASYEDERGFNAGAAYVFEQTGTSWKQQTKLTASGGIREDQFGYSVAISEDTVVIGTPYNKKEGKNAGAAYVFTRDGTATAWSEQAKLTASDVSGAHLGCSVAISGDTIVVGAAVDDQVGPNAGAAYVFLRSGASWSEQAKLTASDGRAYDKFGWAVAISEDGTTTLVGAPYNNNKRGSSAGAAYVFAWDGGTMAWIEMAKLMASDGVDDDYFGEAVAISEDTALMGAPFHKRDGKTKGAAYMFVFEPPVSEDVSVTGEEDTQLVWMPGVSDPDSDLFLYSIATPPAHGSAWVAVNGSYGIYTPGSDYYGADSFTYEVSNGVTAITGTVTVQVNNVNDVPHAEAGGPYMGATGVLLTFDASGSGDIDGDPLQYRWDFDGDGTWDTSFSSEPMATHTYEEAYTGEVIVEVSDGALLSTATSNVTIVAAPTTTSIATVTVIMSEVTVDGVLVSYTLGILSIALLACVCGCWRRKRNHHSAK